MSRFLFILFLFFDLVYAQTFLEINRVGGKGMRPGLFDSPHSLSFGPDGTLYISDTGNNRIQIFDKEGKFIRSIGGFGFNYDQFDHPYDIWTRSALNIYIADYDNQRVVRYDKSMNFISTLESSSGNPSEFQFLEVASVALNSQNELFLIDHGENKIIKYDRNGKEERIFGTYESGKGELLSPQQLEILDFDKLLVTDSGNRAVFVFDFFGNYIRQYTSENFKTPGGIAVDDQSNMYITDLAAKSIFRIKTVSDKVDKIKLPSDQPLIAPADIAIWKEPGKENKTYWMYILDAHDLIIGKFVDE
jgi:DNA-binding beta-propeller fold protein YncE